MANIADLVVSLSADIASFRDGMAQSKQAVSDLQSSFASAKEEAASFIEKIGEFIAAKEVVSFLEESAEATRNWAETLSTFQGIAGLSSKEAATFAASAQLAGVQTEVVTQAMARLGAAIATHPQKFQQLGISIRDASGQLLPMTDILRNTIAGLDEFKAGTDRAAAAGFLFGRGAEQWITQLDKLGPMLKSSELSQTADMLKALGLNMNDAKAQAEEWAKAEGTLHLELIGLQVQVGNALLPVLKELGAEILVLAKDGSFKAWGESAGVVLKALATDAELAAKSIQFVMGLIKANAEANVAVYDRLTQGSRQSILKPWTPSPNGGFVPPDMRGANTGTNATGVAGAGDTGAPDGTKTFNVPDPKTQQLNDSIATLTANLQRETQQNEQLAIAMGQGGDAAKKLQDQFAALNKIDAIRAQALRDNITLSDSTVASLTKLALAEGQSADVLQRATQLHNNLTDAMKKQDEAIQKLVQSSDGLTAKQDEIADKEGLLWAAFNQGTISAQQFDVAIKQLQLELNGPNQGAQEFAKGLSSDLDTVIGKMTDVSAMLEEKQKTKGKDSIFAQLTQDANEFTQSLEKMLIKLLIINPLLNALGLGDQGNGGKQLPTLFGNSNGPGGGSPFAGPGTASTSSSPIAAIGSAALSGGKSVLSFLSGLFGGISGPGSAVDADSSTGASLNSEIVEALSGGGLGIPGIGGEDPLTGFASGGEFDVDGSGGTDTQRVSFLATPGERVSIMSEAAMRGRSATSDSGAGRGGDVNINMPISGVHSDTFRANRHQITGDMLRAVTAAKRYA